METTSPIPLSFRAFLWSVDISKLDLHKHRRYIIHQLLSYGDLDAFAWLKKNYSLPTVQEVFINSPEKVYTERSFSFVTKMLLRLHQQDVAKEKYVSVVS
jgi:hypothetical protein